MVVMSASGMQHIVQLVSECKLYQFCLSDLVCLTFYQPWGLCIVSYMLDLYPASLRKIYHPPGIDHFG
jgi:hypothetical protein